MKNSLENIIIFGASSYLGRNLRKAFSNINVNVYAIFRSKFENESKLASNEHHIFFNGEIESLEVLKVLSQDSTVIINCCGVTGLPDEVENLSLIIESNIGMTSKIFQFMNEFHFNKLIITESYWQFDEFGNESANSLYAEAKIMQFQMAKYFSIKYNFNIAGLVLYDIYGENDDRSKILNQLCKSIALGENLDLTKGDQFIDFVHILDIVEAYRKTAEFLISSEYISNCLPKRFFVKSNEPLSSLKSKILSSLKTLDYDSQLNWGVKNSPDYQIYKPFRPDGADMLPPNWTSKIPFIQGFKRLIDVYMIAYKK